MNGPLVDPVVQSRLGVVIAYSVRSHDRAEYQHFVRTRDDCETVTLPLDGGLAFTVRAL